MEIIMAEVENSALLDSLQCAICNDIVNDSRLCPKCSQIFCQRCIENWLTSNDGICPDCQSAVRHESLVKGYSIDKIRKSTNRLISTLTNRICDKHKNQQLCLFCYSCEANLCIECWFSNDHHEHKERLVPIAEAFKYYKRNLKTALSWLNGQKDTVERMLNQIQEYDRKLSVKNELIVKLRDTSLVLLNSQVHSATLVKILKSEKAIKKLQKEFQAETESIRLDRLCDFISEPTVLVFRLTNFNQTMQRQTFYEQNLRAPYGFEWNCMIATKEDCLNCWLRLVRGKSSEYSVLVGNEPEKIHRFELNQAVEIGVFYPVVHAHKDTQELIVQIRQSYADRFQQLQDYITRLENCCTWRYQFKAVIKSLVTLWKRTDSQRRCIIFGIVIASVLCTFIMIWWIVTPIGQPTQTHYALMEQQVEQNDDEDSFLGGLIDMIL